jgi:hypothetical protein
VLASRYRPALAPSRGILITSPGTRGEPRHVGTLVEKPGPVQARAMEQEHGTGSLLMLEGRAWLSPPFIQFARARQQAMPGREPRLALAIGAYTRAHPVVAVLADGDVIDLGAPEVPAPREALPGASTRRSQVTPASAGARSGW